MTTIPPAGWMVCVNNYIALGCVSAIRERGMDIPGEIAVMAFDDHPSAQIMKPTLTVLNIEWGDGQLG